MFHILPVRNVVNVQNKMQVYSFKLVKNMHYITFAFKLLASTMVDGFCTAGVLAGVSPSSVKTAALVFPIIIERGAEEKLRKTFGTQRSGFRCNNFKLSYPRDKQEQVCLNN